ncbi:PDZ domain-containing protein, partial [Lentibacillus halophilus]
MAETWLMELWNGIVRFFLNPLVYWTVIVIALSGVMRIRQERKNFGRKLFPLFMESQHTWSIAIGFGLLLSIVAVGAGVVFNKQMMDAVALVTMALSLTLRFTFLSPVYTIGISYLLLLFLPVALPDRMFPSSIFPSAVNFTGLGLLLAILLIAEALLLQKSGRDTSFPALQHGRRGHWIGVHHFKKVSLIPFFILIPEGPITAFASFWPLISINGESYGLALIPFVIGFNHAVQGSFPKKAADAMVRPLVILAMTVLLLAVGSLYVGWLSLAAIITGIIGREYINYRHRQNDRMKESFFHKNERGIKVLAVIPDTPAYRLGITAGETVTKVNGTKINNMTEFYAALQRNGAFFKVEIIGDNGEARLLQSAFYEKDHHELGIISANARSGEKAFP